MQKVIVASTNPVKINTTKEGFNRMFPKQEFEVTGVAVPSNVSDQPMTEQETLLGATNRATNAKNFAPDADYWVGIEGGLEKIPEGMEAFAWMVIISKNGKTGRGRTGSFFLPDKVVELINQGKELGEADDIVFNKNNSKQSTGAIGILTGDVISRTSYYEPAIIFALIPFKNENLY